MNANRGYTGWSMSNRAVIAYESGRMPKTKLKSYFHISEKTFNYMKDNDLLEHEIHHTSKFFNLTDFWQPSFSGLLFLKNIGNEVAINKLRAIARERLAIKCRPPMRYNENGWKKKVTETFPQSWGIAVINACHKAGVIPILTPLFCQKIQDVIEVTSFPQDISARKGRKILEHQIMIFLLNS